MDARLSRELAKIDMQASPSSSPKWKKTQSMQASPSSSPKFRETRKNEDLVDEVARRGELRAEDLERQFRERMDASLSIELAKIERARRRVNLLVTVPLGESRTQDIEHELSDEEAYIQMYHLRQRYDRLLEGSKQVLDSKAHLSGEELRQRLKLFYEGVCPTKLSNVARIVDSFEARGATRQALRDLNNELLDTYGCDLYSVTVIAEAGDVSSTHVQAGGLALQERLDMLSESEGARRIEEARNWNKQCLDHQAERRNMLQDVSTDILRKSTCVSQSPTASDKRKHPRTSFGQFSELGPYPVLALLPQPLLQHDQPNPAVQQEMCQVDQMCTCSRRHQLSMITAHMKWGCNMCQSCFTYNPRLRCHECDFDLCNTCAAMQRTIMETQPQIQTQPAQQPQIQAQPPQQTQPRIQAQPPQHTLFVGVPSPRWAGSFSAKALAKYSYTGQQADELKFAAGDVVTITGESSDGWYWGYTNGRKGLVPANFVKVIQRSSPQDHHHSRKEYQNQNQNVMPPSIGIAYDCVTGQAPVIRKVDVGSPAQKAGLLQGDQILSISSSNMPTRTEVIGFLGDQLTALLKQTFQAAALADGKMILQMQRSQGGVVHVFFAEVAPDEQAASENSPSNSVDRYSQAMMSRASHRDSVLPEALTESFGSCRDRDKSVTPNVSERSPVRRSLLFRNEFIARLQDVGYAQGSAGSKPKASERPESP